MKAILEIKASDAAFLDEFIEKYSDVIKPMDSFGVIESDIIQAIVTITTSSLPVIASVIIAFANAKKDVCIKYKDIEVKGLNEKNAKELIQALLEREQTEE